MVQEAVNAAEPLACLIPLSHDDEMLIGSQLCRPRLLLQETHEPRGIGETVVVEAQHRAFGPGFDFRHAGIATKPLDRDDFQKVFDFAREWTEAIDELGGEGIDLAAIRR